jgi:hypothetical protein
LWYLKTFLFVHAFVSSFTPPGTNKNRREVNELPFEEAANAQSMRASSIKQCQIRKEKKRKAKKRERRRYAPGKPSILACRTQDSEPERSWQMLVYSGCEAKEATTFRSFSSSRQIHPVHPRACACGRPAASGPPDGQVLGLRSCHPRVCRLLQP